MKNYRNPILITADFPPFAEGGVAKYSKDIYDGLKRVKINPLLITCSPQKSYNFNDQNIYCLYNRFYYNKALKYLWFNVISFRLKKKLFKTKKCSLIHSLSSCQSDMGLARLITNKYLTSVLNTFSQVTDSKIGISKIDKILRWAFNHFMKLNEYFVIRLSKSVVAISNGTKKAILKDYHADEKKIKVIQLFINKENFTYDKRKPLEKNYILSVGRLVPRKGFEYLLDAFHEVSLKNNKIKLVIVGDQGDKDYEKTLVEKIKRYKMKDRVVIKKNVSNKELSKLYQDSMFFVFTSQVEGFGLVLLETMSFGKPIIAFNIPAVNELVKDKRTGFLVKNKNTHELSEKIQCLMQNKTLRKNMGKVSLKISNSYTEKKTIASLLKIYESVQNGK